MKLRLVILSFLVLLVAGVRAQQIVTLTTPAVVTDTGCKLRYVGLDLLNSRVLAEVELQPSGKVKLVVYGPSGVVVDGVQGAATPTGVTALHAVNIGNFSGAQNQVQFIYARLALDGICIGTVSGTPQ